MLRSTLLLAIGVAGAGCVSYESHKDLVSAGSPGLHLVELGATTTDELRETLGDPATVNEHHGETIWQYRDTVETSRRFRALPLLTLGVSEQRQRILNFAIRDDVVTRRWTSLD